MTHKESFKMSWVCPRTSSTTWISLSFLSKSLEKREIRRCAHEQEKSRARTFSDLVEPFFCLSFPYNNHKREDVLLLKGMGYSSTSLRTSNAFGFSLLMCFAAFQQLSPVTARSIHKGGSRFQENNKIYLSLSFGLIDKLFRGRCSGVLEGRSNLPSSTDLAVEHRLRWDWNFGEVWKWRRGDGNSCKYCTICTICRRLGICETMNKQTVYF